MIITHNEIDYEVSALSGWDSHLYEGGLHLDVLKILAEAQVVSLFFLAIRCLYYYVEFSLVFLFLFDKDSIQFRCI